MLGLLFLIGLLTGTLAAFFGMSGGVILLPILTYMGYPLVNAIGVSSLCSFMSTASATYNNLLGHKFFNYKRIFSLMIPAVISAQIGVYFVRTYTNETVLLTYVSYLFVLIIIAKYGIRTSNDDFKVESFSLADFLKSLTISFLAGLSSGAFGIGGGILMVPLQSYWMHVPIKIAIKLSSAVIIFTTLSSFIGHFVKGGVLIEEGLTLGFGGIIGAKIGSYLLKKVDAKIVKHSFILMLFILIISILYKILIK